MQPRTRVLALVVATQLAALFCAAARAEEVVSSERRLPREVVAYLSIRNVGELRTQWAQTMLGKLGQDEALADLWKAVGEKIDELSQQVEQQLGLTLAELANIPQGEVTIAAAVGADGKPAGVLLLDFGQKEEDVRKLLGKLEGMLEQSGFDRNEDEFEDTKLVLFKQEAQDGNQGRQELGGYCVKDTTLVIASSAEALKGVLGRWDGKSANVAADNAVFRYVADHCRDESQEAGPLVSWYFDPVGLIKAGLATRPDLAFQGSMVLGFFPAFGIDRLKAVGGSVDMARGDYDVVTRTLVYMEPPPRGVINLFQFDSGEQAPPAWVAADSSSFTAVTWRIDKAWSAAEALVDAFPGSGGRGTFSRKVEELTQDLGGLHLKKDVVDILTGRIHVVGEMSDSEEDVSERYLFAAEVKAAASAKATLRKLAQIPMLNLQEREFQGETIYEIDSPGVGGETTRMGLGIAENHLMFATDVKLLERVMRGTTGTDRLADSAQYRRVASLFPEKTASISYSRQNTELKALLALLKSPGIEMISGLDLGSLVSKLPSYETIKKYMPSAGSYMQPDERGLKFTSFSLRREAE